MLKKELKALADSKREKDAELFMLEHLKIIQDAMREEAKKGLYRLEIIEKDSLNIDGWITKPYLYKPVIKKLEKDGLKVYHSDDRRDGIYIIIEWFN